MPQIRLEAQGEGMDGLVNQFQIDLAGALAQVGKALVFVLVYGCGEVVE